MAGTRNSFVWYELMTSDAVSAKAFYADVVGWSTQDVPMPGMTYTLLRVGDTQVGGLMPLPSEASAAGMRPCWIGYIGIDDADSAAVGVKRLGGRILGEPRDIPGVGRFAMATDPQGAAFNLFKPTQSGERAASSAPGHIGWHELHTTDWPKALRFYSELLGWVKGDSMDMGPMGTYQLFNVGEVPAGAMFNDSERKAAPIWLYYFNVGDIDDAAKRVTDGGGKIVRSAHQVPGGNWIVHASDPQGATFALLGSKK
jgi:predicted enzyme related to lactoylglutathione lyase